MTPERQSRNQNRTATSESENAAKGPVLVAALPKINRGNFRAYPIVLVLVLESPFSIYETDLGQENRPIWLPKKSALSG
ncbi:MAG: hypothetical protein DME19_07330 [Verrucomicrobia bacterium]|nr:MAG: hypothetical protein DME19_07330 [Verrucomicrobiota bacterium]